MSSFLVDQQKGTEEIANRIKENPAHWNLILSDLFMSTNEGKGSLGGLLIADALIPLWEFDPKFPVKLIIISNKERRVASCGNIVLGMINGFIGIPSQKYPQMTLKETILLQRIVDLCDS